MAVFTGSLLSDGPLPSEGGGGGVMALLSGFTNKVKNQRCGTVAAVIALLSHFG